MEDEKLMEDFILIKKSEYVTLLRHQSILDTLSDFIRRGGYGLEDDLRLILGMSKKEDKDE